MNARLHWLPRVVGTVTVTVVCCGAVLFVSPRSARAHSLPGSSAGRFRAAVTSVSPPDPHLAVTCTADGQGLQVTYTGSEPLIVKGYGGEDYLRVGPAGVDENERSPSAWFNRNRPLGGAADYSAASQPPTWRHVSAEKTVVWYDYRLYWLGSGNPPSALADPGHSHLLKTWTVTLTVGRTPTLVVGTLTWLPPRSSSRALFIELGLEGAAFGAAVLLIWRHHLRSRRPQPAGPAAARRPVGS
ncbi:MAG: hypothetical protein QOJ83_899 [Frankiales bacterium]|nr:hypothetical protein [Frankiales bacterium]